MPRKLLGNERPRLYTGPQRPLNRRTSLGYEVADFAEITGEPLLPWERWAAIHALELNPDGSFRFRIVVVIAARQNGKSHLKRTISLWRLYMYPGCRVLGVAQEVGLAREQWNLAQETIHAAPDLAAEFHRARNVNGDEMFWLRNRARYAIKAASRKAGRGGTNDEVNIDELREQRDWRAWAALFHTTMARANSQIWCMSNAGDDESVVLNQLQDSGHAGRDPSLGIFEWSAPDGCELDDPRAWAQANPGLGHIISGSAIRSALAADPPEVFRTEVLCQRVPNLDSAIDLAAWKDCADPSGTLDSHRGRVMACFDMAPDGQHATLAAAALLADGRPRVEVVEAWRSSDEARLGLAAALERVRPQGIGWYPGGPAAAFAPILRPPDVHPKGTRPPEYVELTGGKVAEACQGLADLARARGLLHPADPLLDAHIAGATKLPSGDGWRFTRRGGYRQGHVDAAYAAAGAVYLALTVPVPERARIRVLG